MECCRAEALSLEVVNNYFNLLENTLSQDNLLSKPRQVYDCDETFLPLNENKDKVVALRNAKSVYSQAMGTTEHITMLCCVSCAGTALPPMNIYPGTYPGGQYRLGGPDDTLYAKSTSGWIDSELFLLWFKKLFLKFAVSERPLVLIVDGHKSHENIELIDCARKNNIILLCLPPHTTHALQPLDVSVFKSLKSHFSKALRAWCFTKKDFVVTKRDFARVVKEPFESSFSITNIKSGFAKCGIYPLNHRAIPQLKMLPSELNHHCTPVSRNVCDVATSPIPDESNTEASSMLMDESMSDIAAANSTEDHNMQSPSTDRSAVQDQSCSQSSVPTVSSRLISSQLTASSRPPSATSSNTDSYTETPGSSNTTIASPLSNPLVMAGLVPQNLADILSTSGCEEVQRKPKRRVFKARVLTEQEFFKL